MAYSDFTIDRLSVDFGVDFTGAQFFAEVNEVPPVEPNPWLLETLALGQRLGFGGAKARSERLISPLLAELARRNDFAFAIAPGRALDADPARSLLGTCDFVLSFSRVQDFGLDAACCITVASGSDTDPTLDRCAAQLFGARQLNQRTRYRNNALYGCSTTGIEWQFMRFEANIFTLDPTHYLISEPARLLGVFQHIVNQTLAGGLATPASPDSPLSAQTPPSAWHRLPPC